MHFTQEWDEWSSFHTRCSLLIPTMHRSMAHWVTANFHFSTNSALHVSHSYSDIENSAFTGNCVFLSMNISLSFVAATHSALRHLLNYIRDRYQFVSLAQNWHICLSKSLKFGFLASFWTHPSTHFSYIAPCRCRTWACFPWHCCFLQPANNSIRSILSTIRNPPHILIFHVHLRVCGWRLLGKKCPLVAYSAQCFIYWFI